MSNTETSPKKTKQEKRQELECFLSVPKNHEATQQRFLSKVDKNGPIPERCPELGPCWLWTGATNGFKPHYGKFPVSAINQQPRAHVVAYLLKHGLTPENKSDIDHLCGNPLCVNPDHLEAVTHRENMRRAHKSQKTLPMNETSRDARFFDAVTHQIDGSTILEIQEKTGHSQSTVSNNRKTVKGHPFIGPLVEETIEQNEQAALDDAEFARSVDAWKADPTPQLERRTEHLSQKAQQQQSSAKEQHTHDQ